MSHISRSDFFHNVLVPLFPQLKEIRGIRRILLDVEVGKEPSLTIETINLRVPDDSPIMKHYELVEKESPLEIKDTVTGITYSKHDRWPMSAMDSRCRYNPATGKADLIYGGPTPAECEAKFNRIEKFGDNPFVESKRNTD